MKFPWWCWKPSSFMDSTNFIISWYVFHVSPFWKTNQSTKGFKPYKNVNLFLWDFKKIDIRVNLALNSIEQEGTYWTKAPTLICDAILKVPSHPSRLGGGVVWIFHSIMIEFLPSQNQHHIWHFLFSCHPFIKGMIS